MGNSVGKLSVSSENIFPIIKDKLYDNQDTFVRELVSNCVDAITKRKLLGNHSPDVPARIDVLLNREENTITFLDTGVGMTSGEVDAYINRIAFSGANDFVRRNAEKASQSENDIIGHFGLGFYSAFMVADQVEIRSLSYNSDAHAVHWACSGQSMEYSISNCDKQDVGTEVILHTPVESPFLSGDVMRRALVKYCTFCPFDLYLTVILRDEECQRAKVEKTFPSLKINATDPIWTKHPKELSDSDYIEFYHQHFEDFCEPVFWLNLYNEDLGVKGILYCRHIDDSASSINGEVKLYSRQVFVANNLKGVIPDFLMLQNGIVDIRQLPLNASRSSMREDGYADAIQEYLAKQIGVMLKRLFELDRPRYEGIWPEINPFVKLGILQNKSFRREMISCVLYQFIGGAYWTLDEYLAQVSGAEANPIYYVSDEVQQAQYISLFRKANIPAAMLAHVVDSPFIRFVELDRKHIQFKRIDADLEALIDSTATTSEVELAAARQALERCYRDILDFKQIHLNPMYLKSEEITSLMVLDEESRRVQEVAAIYNLEGSPQEFPLEAPKQTLVLNLRSPLVQTMMRRPEHSFSKIIAMQLLDLAQLSQESLQATELVDFIDRSNFIMERLLERIEPAKQGDG